MMDYYDDNVLMMIFIIHSQEFCTLAITAHYRVKRHKWDDKRSNKFCQIIWNSCIYLSPHPVIQFHPSNPPHWGGVSVSNYDNAYNSDDDSNLFQGRSPHQQTQPQGAQWPTWEIHRKHGYAPTESQSYHHQVNIMIKMLTMMTMIMMIWIDDHDD